jgi:hypothetical protein
MGNEYKKLCSELYLSFVVVCLTMLLIARLDSVGREDDR